MEILPEIVKPWHIVGFLSPDEAAKMGLRAGIPIAAGAGDTMQSALASENVREFERALKASGIPLLSWPTDHPFLESVAQAQGFVKFEAAASAKTPESMAYVRTLFAEGKNLELATLLLEDAAARHPANAEVWEYLAGAYFAAGKKDPARICTRVWLSLAEGVREPIFYLTTHFDANEGKSRASDLAQLFN